MTRGAGAGSLACPAVSGSTRQILANLPIAGGSRYWTRTCLCRDATQLASGSGVRSRGATGSKVDIKNDWVTL